MHILIIPSERYIPNDEPLQGIFQHQLAQALMESGHKVGVLSLELLAIHRYGKKYFSIRKGYALDNDNGISVLRYSAWKLIPKFPDSDAWLIRRLIVLIYNRYCELFGKPDFIHAHNALFAGYMASILKTTCGVPYVLTEHSSAYQDGKVKGARLKFAAEAFHHADIRTVVSTSLGRVLQAVVGNKVDPFLVLPNILDRDVEEVAINYYDQRAIQRKEEFRFLNIGNLVEVKNHEILLHAFATAFRNIKNIRLRIGGSGHLLIRLQKLSYELGITDQVTFIGHLDRLAVMTEIQNCDVFVLPSLHETFGVVLIEALSFGKPIISTACGGPEDIVKPHNGIIIKTNDKNALSEAMTRMIKTINEYDSELIKKDCINNYGAASGIERFDGVYRRVAGDNVGYF